MRCPSTGRIEAAEPGPIRRSVGPRNDSCPRGTHGKVFGRRTEPSLPSDDGTPGSYGIRRRNAVERAGEGQLLQLLSCIAQQLSAQGTVNWSELQPKSRKPVPRRLTVFELARLRRDVQQVVGPNDVPEVLRQIVWSIEEGAL